MGYHRETTPNIDRMAREGLYFENAIASGVATAPSLIGLFTGDYTLLDSTWVEPRKSKKWFDEIFSRKTLAEVLSKKGYSTGALHANPWASSMYGFNKGFEYFQDFLLRKDNKKNFSSRLFSRINILNEIKAMLKKESTFTNWEMIYPEIIDWVKKTKKPYFLWVLLLDTHVPYIPPRKHRKYSNRSQLYLLYLNWKLRRNVRHFCGKNIRYLFEISPREKEEIIRAYDDSIYYADKFIKKIWLDLQYDDPIFIIHADHGDGFGEHGFFYHPPMLYEELIHVPLIIYNADVRGKIEKPVSLLGLAPSILELIGEENEFPSESFLHGGRDWVISQVFEGEKRKVAVRTKDWKFITGQKEEDELYYLKRDPYEQENLIDDYPDLVREFREIAEKHIKQALEIKRIKDIIFKLRF